MEIVDENRNALDGSIKSEIMNMGIKNAEDLLLHLKPISIDLDQMQSMLTTVLLKTFMYGKSWNRPKRK